MKIYNLRPCLNKIGILLHKFQKITQSTLPSHYASCLDNNNLAVFGFLPFILVHLPRKSMKPDKIKS